MSSTGAIRAGRAYVEIFADSSSLVAGLREAESNVKRFAGSLTGIGSSITAVGAAAALPVASAVKTFADFDDQMRAVQAVSGSTGDAFVALTEKAKELGRTTSFTAAQVAEGMLNLGRAGFKSNEIDASIASVMNLSRATQTEIPLATDIAGNALRAFDLDASEMGRVCDVLTATANGSAQTLEDLGEAFKFVAPIAKDAGASIEDAAKIVGTLANFGIKGSLAGTAYKNIQLKMADPAVQKSYEELNVSVTDAQGNLRGMADILRELGAATSDMPNAEKLAKYKDLFSMYGLSGGIKLTSANFDALYDSIDNAAGIAQKTADDMDRGLGGKFRLTESAIEGVAIKLGETLDPTISEFCNQITSASESLVGWIGRNEETVTTVAKLAAVTIGAGGGFLATGYAINAFAGATTALRGTLTGAIALWDAASGSSAKLAAATEANAAVEQATLGVEAERQTLERAGLALDEARTNARNAEVAVETRRQAVGEAAIALANAQTAATNAQTAAQNLQNEATAAGAAVESAAADVQTARIAALGAQTAATSAQTAAQTAKNDVTRAEIAVEQAKNAVSQAGTITEEERIAVTRAETAVEEAKIAVTQAGIGITQASVTTEQEAAAMSGYVAKQRQLEATAIAQAAEVEKAAEASRKANHAVKVAQINKENAETLKRLKMIAVEKAEELSAAQARSSATAREIAGTQASIKSLNAETAARAANAKAAAVDEANARLANEKEALRETKARYANVRATKVEAAKRMLEGAQSALTEAKTRSLNAQAGAQEAQRRLSATQTAVKEASERLKNAQAAAQEIQKRQTSTQATIREANARVVSAQRAHANATAALESARAHDADSKKKEGDAASALNVARANHTSAQSHLQNAQAAQTSAAATASLTRRVGAFFMSMAPFAVVGVAVAALNHFASAASRAADAARDKTEALREQQRAEEDDAATKQKLFDRLTELSEKQNLTNGEFDEGCKIVRQLRNYYGDLGIEINETAKSFENVAEAADDFHERQKALEQQRRKTRLVALQNELNLREKEVAAIMGGEFKGFDLKDLDYRYYDFWNDIKYKGGEIYHGLKGDLTESAILGRQNEIQRLRGEINVLQQEIALNESNSESKVENADDEESKNLENFTGYSPTDPATGATTVVIPGKPTEKEKLAPVDLESARTAIDNQKARLDRAGLGEFDLRRAEALDTFNEFYSSRDKYLAAVQKEKPSEYASEVRRLAAYEQKAKDAYDSEIAKIAQEEQKAKEKEAEKRRAEEKKANERKTQQEKEDAERERNKPLVAAQQKETQAKLAYSQALASGQGVWQAQANLTAATQEREDAEKSVANATAQAALQEYSAALKELTEAENSGDQERIESAKDRVDEASIDLGAANSDLEKIIEGARQFEENATTRTLESSGTFDAFEAMNFAEGNEEIRELKEQTRLLQRIQRALEKEKDDEYL